MSGFSRFSESDYRRLSECDRWTVAETANFIIEAKKNIDGSVGSPGYDADCQEMFVGYLNNVFVFWRSKKDLKVYGPAGDLGSPLIEDREVFSQCGLDEWGLDATSFFMKKDVLAILRKSNPSVFTYIEDKLSSNADNSILPQFSACHESLSRAKLYDNKNDSDSPKGPDRVKGEARIDSEIREFSNESVTVGILSEEAPSPAVVSGEVIESSLQPGKGDNSEVNVTQDKDPVAVARGKLNHQRLRDFKQKIIDFILDEKARGCTCNHLLMTENIERTWPGLRRNLFGNSDPVATYILKKSEQYYISKSCLEVYKVKLKDATTDEKAQWEIVYNKTQGTKGKEPCPILQHNEN